MNHVAAACGVSEHIARRWETDRAPDLTDAFTLADALGCTLDDFLVPNPDREARPIA